jgi:hypothetical protein
VGYQAELRHSQPGFALSSFAVVRLAIHPCGKPQGILAKPNKNRWRFQVEVGFFLSLIMGTNVILTMTLHPLMVDIIMPKFITRKMAS